MNPRRPKPSRLTAWGRVESECGALTYRLFRRGEFTRRLRCSDDLHFPAGTPRSVIARALLIERRALRDRSDEAELASLPTMVAA